MSHRRIRPMLRLPARADARAGRWCITVFLLLAVLAAPSAATAQAGGAAVWGRVVDADGGRGLGQVEIILQGTGAPALTNDRGQFRIHRVPPGVYVLRARRLGYQVRVDTLDVPEGVSVEVVVELSVEPIELEGLEVVTRSLLLETRGFYERKSQGFRGVFLDRPTIEDRDPLYVADLFRNIPGVEVVDGARLIMSQSVNLMGGGRGCEPALWLDGVRSGMRNYDFIRPDHLEGVEVYTGGGAPGKYNDLCGTVVIWTRVPMRRR